MRSGRTAWGVVLALVVGAAPAAAEEKFSVVAGGLKNPCGVAVQPGSGSLVVADSEAGRIIKIDPATGTVSDLVTGFGQDIYGKGPMYKIGPLGVAFVGGPGLLAVGGGSNLDAAEVLTLHDTAAPSKAEAAKHTLGPIGAGEASAKGEGNFYGLAASKSAIYVTSNGDDTKGWILKAELKSSGPGKLTPFIATKELVGVDAPVGITLSAEGNIVVGQMGEVNMPKDSLLTAYDPSGKLVMKAETGLHDIAGLAFSPKTGKLYAVDFAWIATGEGGLFRLDVTKGKDGATVKAERIATLDRPTALAFGADGALYVTVFGVAGKEGGALVKFAPGL